MTFQMFADSLNHLFYAFLDNQLVYGVIDYLYFENDPFLQLLPFKLFFYFHS